MLSASQMENHIVLMVMAHFAKKCQAPWQLRQKAYMRPLGTSGDIEIKAEYELTANKLDEHLDALAALGIKLSWPSLVSGSHTIAKLTHSKSFLVLDSNGHPVGASHEGDVFIRPAHRKLGLGAELFLTDAVLVGGGRMGGLLYSPSGHAAALSSHKLALSLKPADAMDEAPKAPHRMT